MALCGGLTFGALEPACEGLLVHLLQRVVVASTSRHDYQTSLRQKLDFHVSGRHWRECSRRARLRVQWLSIQGLQVFVPLLESRCMQFVLGEGGAFLRSSTIYGLAGRLCQLRV